MTSPLDRRQWLAAAAGGLALLATRPARALGPDAQVGIGLLQHGTGFDQRPRAVEQLMWETTKRTSIDVRSAPVLVSPEDPELFRQPLLVWLGTGACEPLSEGAIQRLSRFLRAGGCLWIDDATPPGNNAFDECVRREVKRLFPDAPLARVSNDHTLYRSFFLLERPVGRLMRNDYLEGITFEDRSPLFYSRNDLFGAYGRDSVGGWLLPVTPGGEVQREMAFRLGINLLMYVTCLDYKRDQVHVTAILRRRRWRIDNQENPR